jgi:hypothetical protein
VGQDSAFGELETVLLQTRLGPFPSRTRSHITKFGRTCTQVSSRITYATSTCSTLGDMPAGSGNMIALGNRKCKRPRKQFHVPKQLIKANSNSRRSNRQYSPLILEQRVRTNNPPGGGAPKVIKSFCFGIFPCLYLRLSLLQQYVTKLFDGCRILTGLCVLNLTGVEDRFVFR